MSTVIPLTKEMTRFLDLDLASFKARCTRELCQSLFSISWRSIPVWGRVWACIHRGRVFTTSADACPRSLLANPGCGICRSGGDRKDSFHRLILTYNELYRPAIDVCITLNCQDAPVLYRSGLVGFAYTGSPSSYDVPFPDYTTWQSYPLWLQDLERSPPPPWHEKLRRAVLVGGATTASNLRRMLFGGVCNEVFHRLGFVDMAGVTRNTAKLRDGNPIPRNATGRDIAAALADRNATGLRQFPFVPRSDLCRYRMIVLSTGHSRWLDHMKHTLLCKSLVVNLVSLGASEHVNRRDGIVWRAIAAAYSPIERVLKSGVTHVELVLNHSSPDMCSKAANTLQAMWDDDAQAHAIASRGEATTRQHYSVQGIYDYVDAAIARMAAIQKGAFNVSTFIEQHRGVEITHDNYDNVTKRVGDYRFAKWERPPKGSYTGWLGSGGWQIGMEQLRLMLPRVGHGNG